MHLRLWAIGAASLLTVLAGSAVAQASVGVGIQAGPVRLSGSAHPGGSYALPPVYVVNTGTQDESLSVRIERLSSGQGRGVPASWIHSGSAVQLAHGQSARISLELVVPGGARPGQYVSDVVVRGSAPLSDGGANLAVAAATKLQFRVAAGAVAAAWFSVPGWLVPGVGVVLLIAAAAAVARRYGLRVRIDREPAGASPLRAGRGKDAA
jgi:hypothetical protein